MEAPAIDGPEGVEGSDNVVLDDGLGFLVEEAIEAVRSRRFLSWDIPHHYPNLFLREANV
jgi:hypothetical protein